MTSAALVDALQATVGTPGHRVVGVRRSVSEYSSSFRIEDLSVAFDGGEHQEVVGKDLSWQGMLDGARALRSERGHDPGREVRVYRHVLPLAPPGPPRLLGWHHDDAADRHWLFLERVEGLQLGHVGDLDAWRAATGWAGRLHARLAGDHVRAWRAAGLPTWTPDRLGRALRLARRHGGERTRDALAVVQNGLATVAGRLLAAPRTIVHGQLYASNVLVGAGSPPRICPLDWETAAIGPGVLDLAALVEGWDDATCTEFCRAYLEGRDGACRGDDLDTLRMDVAAARVQLCLDVLALPPSFRAPPDHGADWVGRAAELTTALAACA